MVERFQIILLIVVIIGAGWFTYDRYVGVSPIAFLSGSYSTVHVGGIPIRVDIATTRGEREQGLSGRNELEDGRGLLMVFETPGYHGVWMKDMQFPIDVIWISEDLRVIGVRQHITPDTYPEIFEPPRPAKYILETEAFFTDVYGITVGDNVLLPERLN